MKRALALILSLSLTTQVGCLTKLVISSQAAGTRKAGKVGDTLGDLNIARTASMNGLAQSEGMHDLSPNNEDVLFLLTRGWTSYGYAFAQNDLANYEEGTEEYEDTKRSASLAYDRAVKYGLELIGKTDEGFEAAKKNEKTMKEWLGKNFDSEEHAQRLYWLGSAWMARVGLRRDEPALVGELWVGAMMMERSLELSPEYNDFGALSALGSYHARASVAELDEAKKLFELALAKTERKNMSVQLGYATKYACVKNDRDLYDALMKEILQFDDSTAPNRRLSNTLAKQMARKAIKPKGLKACGFDPTKATIVRKASNAEKGELSVEDFFDGPATPAKPTAAPINAPPVTPPASATAGPSVLPTSAPSVKVAPKPPTKPGIKARDTDIQ
jgi:TRAP transporter T-component